MKNILRNILISGVAVTMLASCDLDLFPTTAIPYEDGDLLIQSEQDIAEFQNGVIASYRSLQYGTFYQTVEVMSECFNATVDFGNNYGFVHRLGDDFLASDEYIATIWSSHYAAIKNYNVAIEQCEMIKDTTLIPSANILKGMALFCRASSYLSLARAFAPDYDPATASTTDNVPLILKYNQWEKPVRAKTQKVYEQIIFDLMDAEDLLSAAAAEGTIKVNGTSVNLAGSPRSVVPTLDAIKALKARYYLDTHDYYSAAVTAEDVIKSSAGYALATNEDDMIKEFMYDEGNESLIRLFASKSEGVVGCSIYTGVADTSEEGKFFSPMFLPSQTIINVYDNTDLRKKVWFPMDYYPVKVNGILYDGIHVFTKYLGCPNLQEGKNEDARHYAKPLMLAEMYLIAAEAYAQDTDNDNAKRVLNALQTARKANLTDGSLQSVKKEWMRETVGDGQRINCIKRWGDGMPARPAQKAAEEIVAATPPSDYAERVVDATSHTLVWPIPSYELKITPDLGQNNGY